ncbi:glycosyltransferase [Cesiribacter sp. SM1]|uniref:glycosyltransferase n=1 Tax=Cesiribacter sp. SM1 TaxID=2861196 RepID=UPI001CD3E322|nr:glycosyltransferase [Cesiribacter sp. SM1]
MSIPLSVVILTYNEASSVAEAIESVLWADEVLIVDSYSNDNTLDIASEYNVRILQHKFENYSKQRNWAIEQAKHNWIFMLDADERICSSLKEEMVSLLQTSPPFPAYQVKRHNYLMGKRIRYSGWQNDWVTRLFDRRRAGYGKKAVHESLLVEGKTGNLKNPMSHYTYKNLETFLEKHNEYSKASAEDLAARGIRVTYYHMLVKPAFRFFRSYILKLGFLDGKEGLFIASLYGWHVYLRYVKAWRLRRREYENRPLKVLHLSSETSWRGGEQQIAYLIEELAALGVENIVACQKGSPFEAYCRDKGIKYFSLSFRNSLDLKTALSVKQICRSEHVDLVHIHSSKSHGIAIMADIIGNDLQLILSRRVDFPPKTNFFTSHKYNYPHIRRILCVSEAIRQVMLPHIDEKDKLYTVYSGIDLQKFSREQSTNFLRSKWGIPQDKLLVGNISAIAPHKDYFTFVDTAEELLKRKLPIAFFIIGSGPEERTIKAYVEEKGLQEHIIFPGFLNNIPQILPELDIFLMTSETEGLGTTLLDAFAAKVPVVATRAGGIPEIVRHEQTGLTAAVKDVQGLADGVERLVKQEAYRKQLSEQAYVFVKSFDKKQTALQTLAHYRQVLQEKQ